ncbi:substrate-binding domain-containing protein [Planosporangium flavigriseum]|uniref:Periplasmic binding protein domain-containing protein n=1 Tax=Planosporangium flavigriseum TaxID=373681 RepID=A0A8J3M2J5_9ACTN|nr:substrate-binding domain-containing protein [Planosporangium flavigriseum]NJC67480.1 substrate-binding domain-containing protein [Planosporangium flavigriseum]GIG75570.1 hypothetical protein Pfl04_39740 [Planosporangium flavigriseum]
MRSTRKSRGLLLAATALCLAATAACSAGTSSGSGGDSASAVKLDPAKVGPTSVIGQGPNGEPAASPDQLKISDEDAAKLKAGKYKVGLVMHTLNLDFSKLQIQGMKDTFDKYGVEIIGTTDASYKVDQQTADLENMIQRKPNGIISLPVDNTAMAPAFKKVSQAGIKLVLIDNLPTGFKHPADYSAVVSADSQGNGQIAAEVLAARIPKDGTIGIVGFGIDFFVTNERVKGVKDWLAKNRSDIKIKQANFTDQSKVSQTAGDFLTANPDVKGVFVVWDAPAMDTLSAMRAQGITVPVTTIDLGLQAALEIAKGGPLKGLGAQRPYDQGVAEAMALLNAFLGKEPPAWVGVQSLPVIQSNVLESYKTVFHADPPADLVAACKSAGSACG